MNLVYIATIRFPTEKAHGLQIAKMCEALSRQKINTTLLVPNRDQCNLALKNVKWQDFYQINTAFRIVKLPAIDILIKFYYSNIPHLVATPFFLLLQLSFYFSALKYLRGNPSQIIFTREPGFLPFGKLAGKDVYLEVHDFPRTYIGRTIFLFFIRYAKGIIVTNQSFKDFLLSRNVSIDRILSSPNATDSSFLKKRDKTSSRKKLSLPQDKIIILHSGTLKTSGSLTILLQTAKRFSTNPNIYFVLIGKAKRPSAEHKIRSQIEKKQLNNIIYLGYQPPNKIPLFLAAADILLFVYSSSLYDRSFPYLSPLKIYEYMASRRPIIATNIQGLKNIASPNQEALFYQQDNPNHLAKNILFLLDHPQQAKKIANQAYLKVRSHTWNKRAKDIVKFISDTKGQS